MKKAIVITALLLALAALVYFFGWYGTAAVPVAIGATVNTKKKKRKIAQLEQAATESGEAVETAETEGWENTPSRKIPPLLIVLMLLPAIGKAECVKTIGPPLFVSGVWQNEKGERHWCKCPGESAFSPGVVVRMPAFCVVPKQGLLIDVKDYGRILSDRQKYFSLSNDLKLELVDSAKETDLAYELLRDTKNAHKKELESADSRTFWYSAGLGVLGAGVGLFAGWVIWDKGVSWPTF